MEKKLLRSAHNKVIGGVCGGIGEYCNVDPTVIRVLYAVLTFFGAVFPGLILYLILLVLIPSEETYTK